MALVTLKKRPEFLRIRGGRRWSGRSFLLECKPRVVADATSDAVPDVARFGFTVTKKLGNAVTRNRIRRRLKSAITALAPDFADPTCDYVVLARGAAKDCDFQDLCGDMRAAFKKLKSNQKNSRQSAGRGAKHQPKR